MRKILIGSLSTILLLSGCGASKGVELKEFSKSDVKYEFKKADVINSKKVIISKDKLAFTTGMIVGGTTGAVVGGATGGGVIQGAIIGGVAGGFSGYATGLIIDGNEAEAFEITLRKIDDLVEYKAYVLFEIPNETRVEFVVRENGFVTNIKVE